jgi:hypothetical protein
VGNNRTDVVRVLLRDRFVVGLVAGFVALLGFAGLFFPVSLDEFDHWGVQIHCGTGFAADLDQADVQDGYTSSQGIQHDAAPVGRAVDECSKSVWLRRAWAVPVVLGGAVVLGFVAADRWWRT